MTSFLEAAGNPAIVGFDAGWIVELRRANASGRPVEAGVMTLRRGDYFATVRVARSSAFQAATFEVVIDGLRDADHHQIVAGPYEFVTIRLGWRDLGSGAGAPFTDIGALFEGGNGPDRAFTEVIAGRLTGYERLHGEFQYRTRLSGIDASFHRLRATTATQPGLQAGSPAMHYAEDLCRQAGVPLVHHPATGPYPAIDERIEIAAGSTVAQALHQVATAAHAGGRDAQIPMYVGLDGMHFGPWLGRQDTQARPAKRLEPGTGLVECRPVMEHESGGDAGGGALSALGASTPFSPRQALRFDVVLRGRADLTIGDTVELVLDEPDPGRASPTTTTSVLGGLGEVAAGLAAAFGPGPVLEFTRCRVVDVQHVVDRATGFVTTLRVERHAPDSAPATAAETEPTARAQARRRSEAARTAALIRASTRERAEVGTVDVGLVRAQSVRGGEADGHAFEAQRVELDAGLQRDGQSNAAVAAPADEVPTRLFNKAYLTPFAYGATGLVVPHYPGMRVVTLNYRRDARHAVVAGCVWPDGEAPEAEAGDYWLSLPVGVEGALRAASASDAATRLTVDKTVHDLTDGDGGRAVHVRGLRISVGQNHLLTGGRRPEDATADEILIEHQSGASIRIDTDGNIEIATDKDLTFKANKITMRVGDKVEVQQ